jgi:hypothetical protein
MFGAPLTLGRTLMPKDDPYHTDSVEYPPEHRNVHHDHNNCPEGKKIEKRHRIENSTGGKPLCKVCAKLG